MAKIEKRTLSIFIDEIAQQPISLDESLTIKTVFDTIGVKHTGYEMYEHNTKKENKVELDEASIATTKLGDTGINQIRLRIEDDEIDILTRTPSPPPSASYTTATGIKISSDGFPIGPDRVQLEALLDKFEKELPNSPRSCTITHLYDAAKNGNVETILHTLGKRRISLDHKFKEHEKETALHAACANGRLTAVHVLKQAGVKLDIMDKKKRTPLIVAVENKQTDIIRYLVGAGVNLKSKGEAGMMCLHMAAKMGYLEACRCFIETDKSIVDVLDGGGWSALAWASGFGHKEVVDVLLDNGAKRNIRDKEGNTALHRAAFSGGSDMCKLLLNRGCDLSSVNKLGNTPLHVAASRDNYDTIKLFLTRDADTVNFKNKEGYTPIMCCPEGNAHAHSWMALEHSGRLKMGISEDILHRDITHGKELTPIQCVNGVDKESFPTDYIYIIENCETGALRINRCIRSLKNCTCEDDCFSVNCFCSSSQRSYTQKGSLLPEFDLLDPPIIFECNRACRCWKNSCSNRVIQHGMVSRLQLFRTKGKGWGVRTLRDIPQGTFICEYIGELRSYSEADQRDDDSYLFHLDNRDGETYCIDARYYGNISRFINRLCDEPNLVPINFFVDHQDHRFPRIAFFSSRNVKAYEELGWKKNVR